jgi:hypothetical protein
MFQEPEVEGDKYQDDSYVRRQPLPEPVFEEQQIDRDDHDYHQYHKECGGHPTSHVNALANVRR